MSLKLICYLFYRFLACRGFFLTQLLGSPNMNTDIRKETVDKTMNRRIKLTMSFSKVLNLANSGSVNP